MLLDGAIHPDDFEVEMMRQHVSTAVSQQEADEHRRQGYPPGLPASATTPESAQFVSAATSSTVDVIARGARPLFRQHWSTCAIGWY